jgi:hypothetical protein
MSESSKRKAGPKESTDNRAGKRNKVCKIASGLDQSFLWYSLWEFLLELLISHGLSRE